MTNSLDGTLNRFARAVKRRFTQSDQGKIVSIYNALIPTGSVNLLLKGASSEEKQLHQRVPRLEND